MFICMQKKLTSSLPSFLRYCKEFINLLFGYFGYAWHAECSGRPIFFLLKKIGFASWPDNMLSQTIYYWQEIFLLTLNVRQWSHPLMISLYCLLDKLNNRTCGQLECDVTWFCFCFYFVCSHARCGCCSTVCWRGWEFHLKLQVQGQGRVETFWT